MTNRLVDTRVNNARNEGADLVEAISGAEARGELPMSDSGEPRNSR